MIERITFDGPVILGAGLAGLSAALAAKTALVLSPTPLATGCSNAIGVSAPSLSLHPHPNPSPQGGGAWRVK